MKRSLLILGLALLAFVAVPATASAKVSKDFFGTTAVDPTDHDYERIAQTGFGVSRFELSWRVIQHTRQGAFNWGYVDARMSQIARAGLEPSLIVYGTPRFVRKSPDGFFPPTDTKENRDEWQDFLRAAVKRYGPGGAFWTENPGLPASPVHQWMIWNEQNARNFWRPKPDPRDYATLVKISDKAIAEVDPDAEIVLGGMYGYPNDERSYKAAKFLKAFYKVKNIERHFDTINVHPYGSGVGTVRKQIAQMRAVANKAGDSGVNTLIGEIGWASTGPSRSPSVVGEKGQATRLRQGLEMLLKKRKAWNITGAYVYLWRDFTLETSCLWCPGAGLVELDGTAKPALKAVRTVIKSAT